MCIRDRSQETGLEETGPPRPQEPGDPRKSSGPCRAAYPGVDPRPRLAGLPHAARRRPRPCGSWLAAAALANGGLGPAGDRTPRRSWPTSLALENISRVGRGRRPKPSQPHAEQRPRDRSS
eukprot:2454583-Pyramimonas_sp.AAC.1